MPSPAHLTERQQKWFAAIRAGLERDTGKSVEEWAAIALACPETAHRKRLAWMKATHGLGQNHASLVLNTAFPSDRGWATPDALADQLWTDPAGRAILARVTAAASKLPDVIVGQRKMFTTYSRHFQLAALRPCTSGALLGLALPPDADAALAAPRRESWSERLKSCLTLATAADVDARIARLLQAAWETS